MKKSVKIVGVAGLVIGLMVTINFLPMLSLKTVAMEELSLSGIRCFAEPDDVASAKRIASMVAEHAAPVTDRLGGNLADDISIIVYPSHKRLHLKTIGLAGVFLPDWYIGNNTKEAVLITSSDNPGPQHSRESVEQAAVHEYVHVLTDRRNKELDHWMKEGLALYLAGQLPPDNELQLLGEISEEEFSTQNSLRFAEVGGYYIAYILIDFLQNQYGWDVLLEFLEPGSNFKTITGRSREELLSDLKQWYFSS